MLPNLIVIGAMNCATTSLYHYLGLHPEIAMSREKELSFFAEELAWGRGIAWYEAQFRPAKVRGEASPTYTMHPRFPGVPGRMARLVPDARLIYLVRDPLRRTVAHYHHAWAQGNEDRAIAEALARPADNRYVLPSLYHAQLQQYLRFFAREQILVIASEDLDRDRAATLRRVFRFLGVEETFWSPRFQLTHHRSALKRRRTALSRRVAPQASALLRRLPLEWRGYAEWLFFYPLSTNVVVPVLPDEVRRDLVRVLRPDSESLVADWGIGTEWLPGLIEAGATGGVG